MTGPLTHHLVRRGIEHVQSHMAASGPALDTESSKTVEFNAKEFLPVFITALLALLLVWSIEYTVGSVIASLAMIESPTCTAIIEPKPPAYADEPDAPLEKAPLMPAEADADADVEVTVIDHKPITAKITTSVAHLHRVGGFRARWRGLGLSILYHFLESGLVHLFARTLSFGILGESLVHIFVSVALARVHMAWTHKMISQPSNQWWFRRLPARKACKSLILPAFVHAVAKQAIVILPLGVAFVLGITQPQGSAVHAAANHHNCSKAVLLGLRFLAVPVVFITVVLTVYLPAIVTLTRIEASLLPEGDETIVPFDKEAITGDIDTNARGGCKAVFAQAWKSFDRASRWRLIKLYAKMVIAELTVVFVALHLIAAEVYVIGGERIGQAIREMVAELKREAARAHEHAL